MARSVFSTGTGKTATVAVIAGFLAAITPNVASIAERVLPEHKADIADVEKIAIQVFGLAGLLGGGLAISNRASASDKVYSPDWMPGFNKSDLKEKGEVFSATLQESRALPPIDSSQAPAQKLINSELTPERYLA